MAGDERDPVDILAEDFADRLRRGERPSVSDFAAAHPEYADELKELLPAVAQMEMLKRFRQPVSAGRSLPDRLGDFRIVRELGRGGMGVVFEAVQESLGRPVALKILARHAQLDPARCERFVREAQAAARLHHTNIVPVFGVGEQDGLPYYVMQLIPGRGLHAVVRQWRERAGKQSVATKATRLQRSGTRPASESGPFSNEEPVEAVGADDWHWIAGVGVQAANALHYAHRQGVLHRDVKPANLIYDGETVWVTDFGLAKLMNVDGLTETGDILGTLQYLPPECLHGDADARSDVYGLGATLYELLTLEPPYTADSPARLIKQVADADPPPPRQFNPAIPRDLETIVLKAMARERAARYASAREMAEDLEAFLEDRPIKARRTSALSRGWRWCRRNPAVASLALSTLLALSLAAVAGWAGYARAEERREEAEREQKNAVQAKADVQQMSERLEANLKLSLATFEKVFDAAGGTGRQGFNGLLPPPVGEAHPGPPGGGKFGPGGPKHDPGPGGPERGPGGFGKLDGPAADSATDKAEILEAVLSFYDEFGKKNSTNPNLQFEAAKASRRVCEAHVWMNRPAKAVAAYQRARDLLESLVKTFPDDEKMREELALTYSAAPPGASAGDRDLPLRRVAELADGRPWLAGTCQFRIGFSRVQAGDLAGAETAYRAAVASFASVEPLRRPPHGLADLTFARHGLSAVLLLRRNPAAAREVLAESIKELSPLAGPPEGPPPVGHGEGPPPRILLAVTYYTLARVCDQLKDQKGKETAEWHAAQYGWHPGWKSGGYFGGKKDGPPKKDRMPFKKDGPKG